MPTLPGDPKQLAKATVAATYPLMMTLIAARRVPAHADETTP